MLKYKFIQFAFLVVFLSTSCDSFFEVDDREKITLETVSASDADVSAMWAYLYYSFDNGFNEISNAMIANACDEADLNQPFSAVQAYNEGSWNSKNTPGTLYFNLYQEIHNACQFLSVTDTLNDIRFNYEEYYYVDKPRYNQLKWNMKAYRMDAEFFKAYCTFELWKRYGNIALVDNVLSKSEAASLQRSSTDDVIAYIIPKLDDVISQFDELSQMTDVEYVNGKWSDQYLGRITKGAVLALKCKVLLYAASPLNTKSGTYDKELCAEAAQAAAQIINMGLYSTNISYREMQFNTASSNPENILDARVGITASNYMEQWNYPLGGSDLYVNSSVGSNATCPSQGLVDSYETVDGSDVNAADPYSNRDPRLKMTVLCNNEIFNEGTVESYIGGLAGIGEKNCTTTGYYLKKFIQDKVKLPSGTTTSHLWYVFRYGEVLLNYAEAMFYAYGPTAMQGYVTNGSDLSAVDAVNLVRNRPGVGMPALPTLSDAQLRNERRIELAFEGQRFWDVRRWKIAEQTENSPLMGMRITKISDNNFSYSIEQIETRKFDNAMYHLPIPYTEMTNYPDWVQNDGWSN